MCVLLKGCGLSRSNTELAPLANVFCARVVQDPTPPASMLLEAQQGREFAVAVVCARCLN